MKSLFDVGPIKKMMEIIGHKDAEALEMANNLIGIIVQRTIVSYISSLPQEKRDSIESMAKAGRSPSEILEKFGEYTDEKEFGLRLSAITSKVLEEYLSKLGNELSTAKKEELLTFMSGANING